MIGKRKIELEEWPAPRRCGQAGQNPHATPAFVGLLEEHVVAPPREGVRLGEVDSNRSLLLDRQRRRARGAAEWADWTFCAPRLARATDHRAKLHQGGVVCATPVAGRSSVAVCQR